jgi:hypothetical protein
MLPSSLLTSLVPPHVSFFHMPTVLYLSKMLIIWVFLVLQTCEVPLVFGDGQKGPYASVIQSHLEELARWAVDKEMTQICWSTFCAVCAAFLIEGLSSIGWPWRRWLSSRWCEQFVAISSCKCAVIISINVFRKIYRLAMHSCCMFIRLLLRMDFIPLMVRRLDLISTLLLQSLLLCYK